MTATTTERPHPALATELPPGIPKPRHWDHAPYPARRRLVARLDAERKAALILKGGVSSRDVVERAVSRRLPGQVPARQWTRDELLAARRAHDKWQAAGRTYELPEATLEAFREYRRAKDAGRSRQACTAVVTAHVLARIQLATDYAAEGITREEAASRMGVTVSSLEKSLRTIGRHDLLRALPLDARQRKSASRRLQQADAYATAGYDLRGAADQMGVRAVSLDRQLRKAVGGLDVLRRLQRNAR